MEIRWFSWFWVGVLVMFLGIAVLASTLYADCGHCGPAVPKDKAPAKGQTSCPVSGKAINKDTYVDVEGFRIYLCCPKCAEKVKADPKTYIEKVKANGEEPKRCPAQCPKDQEKAKAAEPGQCCPAEKKSCQ